MEAVETYVGLDVHRKLVVATALDEGGKQLEQAKLTSDPQELIAFLDRLPGHKRRSEEVAGIRVPSLEISPCVVGHCQSAKEPGDEDWESKDPEVPVQRRPQREHGKGDEEEDLPDYPTATGPEPAKTSLLQIGGNGGDCWDVHVCT
jgi:hypothetical protein